MESLNVLNGFLWTAFIFIISFITVFGIKAAFDFLGIRFNFRHTRKDAPDKTTAVKPGRKRRQGKTIVIDPDGITRISFEKAPDNHD